MTSLATAISPYLISLTQPPNPRMDVKGGQTTTPRVSTQFAEQGIPLPIHDLWGFVHVIVSMNTNCGGYCVFLCYLGNFHLWGDTQQKEITYNVYSRPTEFAHPVSIKVWSYFVVVLIHLFLVYHRHHHHHHHHHHHYYPAQCWEFQSVLHGHLRKRKTRLPNLMTGDLLQI